MQRAKKTENIGNINSSFVSVHMHHNVSPNQLVEFIEVSRLFGADYFIMYTTSTNSSALQPYLEYYIKNQLAFTISLAYPQKVSMVCIIMAKWQLSMTACIKACISPSIWW